MLNMSLLQFDLTENVSWFPNDLKGKFFSKALFLVNQLFLSILYFIIKRLKKSEENHKNLNIP